MGFVLGGLGDSRPRSAVTRLGIWRRRGCTWPAMPQSSSLLCQCSLQAPKVPSSGVLGRQRMAHAIGGGGALECSGLGAAVPNAARRGQSARLVAAGEG